MNIKIVIGADQHPWYHVVVDAVDPKDRRDLLVGQLEAFLEAHPELTTVHLVVSSPNVELGEVRDRAACPSLPFCSVCKTLGHSAHTELLNPADRECSPEVDVCPKTGLRG